MDHILFDPVWIVFNKSKFVLIVFTTNVDMFLDYFVTKWSKIQLRIRKIVLIFYIANECI